MHNSNFQKILDSFQKMRLKIKRVKSEVAEQIIMEVISIKIINGIKILKEKEVKIIKINIQMQKIRNYLLMTEKSPNLMKEKISNFMSLQCKSLIN